MNELELNSLEQCIAHRDAMGGVYLDTCLGERMFVWFNEHPSFAPNLLLVLALLLIIPLLGQGIIKAWEIAKTMKFKEAFYDVTNGVNFTCVSGVLVLLAIGFIMGIHSVQTSNESLLMLSIMGMSLFLMAWILTFSILVITMNSIFLPLAIRDYLRERQEKKKNQSNANLTKGQKILDVYHGVEGIAYHMTPENKVFLSIRNHAHSADDLRQLAKWAQWIADDLSKTSVYLSDGSTGTEGRAT